MVCDSCGNELQEGEVFYCASCEQIESEKSRTRVAWISAEKQARWGDRTALNDLIDQSILEKYQ